jgi:CBS domain-containing protein
VEDSVEIAYARRDETVLHRSGTRNEWLFVVCRGSVRLERDGRSVDLLEEGEAFGFPSLLSGSSPTVDVIAEEDCLLYRIPEAMFERLMELPEFAAFFVEGLHDRLRRALRSDPPLMTGDLASECRILVHRAPVRIRPDATVADAARTMSEFGTSSVLVDTEPLGILTDRDLRNRVLAKGMAPDTPVTRAVTRPVRTLPARATLFELLMLMLENRIHHVPLVEDDDVIGVVTDTDLLRHHLKSPFHLLKAVERSGETAELTDYGDRLSGIVETMVGSGLDPGQIGRVVATLNDAVVVRLLQHAEEVLGTPPCPYAWIVFGSEGRREQALLTDQDNAIVYRSEVPDAADYFDRLAHKVVSGLTEAGFPPCPGGFMATNWCKPLDEWVGLFGSWVERPEPDALLDASNFFDFRSVHGALSLEPLQRILDGAHANHVFLAHLTAAGLRFRPPLGLFRTLKEDEGGIDLKKGGLLPLVSMARVYALEARSRARGTVSRLDAASEAEVLSREGYELTAEAFRFLFRLRLEKQLEARRAGRQPSNRVSTDQLSANERRHLKDAFRQVHQMQEALAHRWRVDALG